MTEDEAKTKWCPFYRLIPETEFDEGLDNRLIGLKEENLLSSRCLASECMAWRWDTLIADQGSTLTHGGCGLAGKQL
jgi:hypothetical protein